MLRLPLICFLWFIVHTVQATRKASCNGWTLKAPVQGDFKCNPLGVTVSMPGTRCTLHCDAGYRPKHEILTCSNEGGWVPTNSPECEADSTMTLVIVLSIVGSIVLIVSLSALYARTSKRCQGYRKRLDEDDPESALRRKEETDTSTYYGRVKRLRRKRLLAERQRQKAARSAQSQKPVTKQPTSERHKEETRRKKKLHRPPQKPRNVTPRNKIIEKRHQSKETPRKSASLQTKPNKKIGFSERMRNIFCIICDAVSGNNEKDSRKPAPKSNIDSVKVFSISEDTIRRERKDSSSSTSSCSSDSTTSTSSSSSSSSSSESSSEGEKDSKDKVAKKKIDDSETPASRPKKTPRKPPLPNNKNKPAPPPRPPAPKLASSRIVSKAQTSSNEHKEADTPASRDHSAGDAALHGQHQPGANARSSGYSSDGDRHRRTRGHSDSAARKNDHKSEHHRSSASHSSKPVARSSAKRMEILSPGDEKPEEVTGNPYQNYPAALSYRQYQNFENDYRRTTGEYRPQYSNVQLIPLQTVKKEGKKEEDDEEQENTDIDKKDVAKCTQGGVKYICISEEEQDSSDGSESDSDSRSGGKYFQKYEEPADRDRRRHSPDYVNRSKRPKREHVTPTRTKSAAQRDRKRQIEGEKIIDDGKRTKKRNEERSREKRKRPSDKSKTNHKEKGDDNKRSKHKRRPRSNSRTGSKKGEDC